MARLVKHIRKRPFVVEKDGVKLFICGCGQSKNLPFCDGTHKMTKDELDDRVYFYDLDGERIAFESETNIPEAYTE